MNSAVLLIVFNRVGTSKRIFEAVRRAAPPRLYIAADGPRIGRPDDVLGCEETRRAVSNVDWPCEVKTLFRTENLGCNLGPAGGISWFFEHEEEGIILEDDCLPVATFFPYCDELLERYRNDERVMQISGSNFLDSSVAQGASYFFSNYPDIWGWATWRRAWRNYDPNMRDWPSMKRKGKGIGVAHGDTVVASYWSDNLDQTWQGDDTVWDYRWHFSFWRKGGINIIPAVSQITNIGFGEGATHTHTESPALVAHSRELVFPLIHPDAVAADPAIDAMISIARYEISFKNVAKARLRKLPVLGLFLVKMRNLFSRRSGVRA